MTVSVVEFDVEIKSIYKSISKGPCYESVSAHRSMKTTGSLAALTHSLVSGVAYVLKRLAMYKKLYILIEHIARQGMSSP